MFDLQPPRHISTLHKASEAKASSLRQLSEEQRKCTEGRPRLPPRLMTHLRHWLCTAAVVLMPGLSPITDGGLIAYGPDTIEPYRRAAGYVDRILRGEKPADLPVQAPTKYETSHQPQDREGARPRSVAVLARPRRRGDRMR
jgi:hypothetical protein